MHVAKEATKSSKIEGTKTNIEEVLQDKEAIAKERRDEWEEVSDLMGDLEKFSHNDEKPFPDLLKIALIHYQFETIHPFLDGNGRVGRLLITLFLGERGILKRPVLYLSDFFERNRELYYDNLMRVRTNNDINQWFKFFLVGVIETAKQSIETFDNIMKLQTLVSRSHNARNVVRYLYQRPLINANKVAEISKISLRSAYKLIGELEKLEIIQEITGAKRGKQYWFRDYIDLFR